jgi:hypothetical protein
LALRSSYDRIFAYHDILIFLPYDKAEPSAVAMLLMHEPEHLYSWVQKVGYFVWRVLEEIGGNLIPDSEKRSTLHCRVSGDVDDARTTDRSVRWEGLAFVSDLRADLNFLHNGYCFLYVVGS